jgi:hypothetical protein
MTKVKPKTKTATDAKPVLADSIISFDTFRKIGLYEQHNLQSKKPSCINGDVSVHRYKVTIELIEESNEVLAERLQKLWDECDNYHHWTPLKNAAIQIGYELNGIAGSLRKK